MQVVSGAAYDLCRCQRVMGSIRVVLLEGNPDVKRKLQLIIAEDPAYAVTGSADSWDDCNRLLEEHVPELLICAVGLIPPGQNFAGAEFPLVIRLTDINHMEQSAVQHYLQQFRRELLQLHHEIYLRKARQLSILLDYYFAGLNSFSYVSALKACRAGEAVEIAVSEIRAIEASGNYVRIYAAGEVCTLRETISGLQSRLDPVTFVRVHRSYIVNTRHISQMPLPDGAPSLIVLNNGQSIPVGPNYRSELLGLLEEPATKLVA